MEINHGAENEGFWVALEARRQLTDNGDSWYQHYVQTRKKKIK